MPWATEPFDPEIANELLEKMSKGYTINSIMLEHPDWPNRANIMSWVDGFYGAPPSFGLDFARARSEQVSSIQDEVIDITDGIDRQAAIIAKRTVDNFKSSLPTVSTNLLYKHALKNAENTLNSRLNARQWTAERMAPLVEKKHLELSTQAPLKLDLSQYSTEDLEQLKEIQERSQDDGST